MLINLKNLTIVNHSFESWLLMKYLDKIYCANSIETFMLGALALTPYSVQNVGKCDPVVMV